LTFIGNSFGKKNYYLSQEQLNKINFKSTEADVSTSKEKRRDIYSEMPIRALGYTNELGEAIRPLSPLLANLSWLPAIGYISADIADKYRQDEFSEKDPSKSRASKQLVTQLLASVFLPTIAVKAGQGITNSVAMISKTGLSLNHKEKISDMVLNSMKRGEHKKYTDNEGKIDKVLYKDALSEKMDEILKHRKTHKKQSPVMAVINFIKKPFIRKPSEKNIKNYMNNVVDRLIDERQQLLDGVKPEKMSEKGFNRFIKNSKDVLPKEKQSMAFDIVRKMEKSRMFNNRILKSVGGLFALSLMAKPIDRFVEHVIMKHFVSPQIDNISELYRKQKAVRKA